MISTIAKSSNAIGTYSHHMPSNGGCAGRPAGSGSPIGRMPQDRSRLPIHTAGSTVISSPSMAMTPLQEPNWANRCASSVTRLPARSTCRCSWTTSNRPSQVRSAAMPSVSSRTIRSLCSGSMTSMR